MTVARRTARWPFAVLVCSLAGVVGCGGEAPPPPEPTVRAVKLLEVGSQDLLAHREYPGQLAATTEARVSSEVSGRILELPAAQGQRVQEGQALARLDPSDYQARLDAAEAQRNAALADFQNVLGMERSLSEQQDQLALSEGQILQDLTSLYRALGGGWDPAAEAMEPVQPGSP